MRTARTSSPRRRGRSGWSCAPQGSPTRRARPSPPLGPYAAKDGAPNAAPRCATSALAWQQATPARLPDGRLMRGDTARTRMQAVRAHARLLACERRPCAAPASPPPHRGAFCGQPLRATGAVRLQSSRCVCALAQQTRETQWRSVSFAAMAPRATRAGALPLASPQRGGKSAASSPPDERLASLRKEMVRARGWPASRWV